MKRIVMKFLAMGNTIVGEDLDDTWRIVIYYNLNQSIVLLNMVMLRLVLKRIYCN